MSETEARLWGTGAVPKKPWNQVQSELRSLWKPGDHFSIIAPTEYGKSVLALRGILPLRAHVVVLDPKGGDDTLTRYGGRKLGAFPSWFERATNDDHHYRIAPKLSEARGVFADTLREVWKDKSVRPPKGDGWTVYLDETRVLSDKLKMRDHLETVWIAGRSRGISLVASTQAPRYVPSEFYDQPKFLAIGNVRDKRAVLRFGEIGGDTDLIREVVPRLDWREFLIIGPRYSVRTMFRPSARPREGVRRASR